MSENLDNPVLSSNNAEHNKQEKLIFSNVKRIFLKDWKEIMGNKDLLLPMIIVPLMFSIFMPIVMGMGAISNPLEFGVTTKYEAMLIMINLTLKSMFLMIPTIVSMIIASDSFAGEKERKTAETILTLPITHRELYLGKLLAAFIPSVIFSVIAFSGMGIISNILIMGDVPPGAPLLIFGDGSFWFVAFVLGGLISLISIQFGIMVSARSKNMKSAQSISGVVIVPTIGLMFGSMVNPNMLSNFVFLGVLSLIMLALVYLMTILGAKVINREKLIANLN